MTYQAFMERYLAESRRYYWPVTEASYWAAGQMWCAEERDKTRAAETRRLIAWQNEASGRRQ